MHARPDLFQNDFEFVISDHDYISDKGPDGIKSKIQDYIASNPDQNLNLETTFNEVRQVLIKTPNFASSANIGTNKNYEIE
jgi:hypothetical protein